MSPVAMRCRRKSKTLTRADVFPDVIIIWFSYGGFRFFGSRRAVEL